MTTTATVRTSTPAESPAVRHPLGFIMRKASPELVALNIRIHATGGSLARARMAANPEARAARIRRLRERGVKVRNAGTLPPLRRYSAPGTVEKLTSELVELEGQLAAMRAREQSSRPGNALPFRTPGGAPNHPARALGRVA